MPVVAGIKALADCGERRLGDRLAGAGNAAHLGARGGDLHHLAARRRGRDIDAAGQAGGSRIGRDRGAGVAGRILVDRADSDLQQMVQHDRGAAILERAGRHLRFELELHRDAIPAPRHQRRPPFAQCDLRRIL